MTPMQVAHGPNCDPTEALLFRPDDAVLAVSAFRGHSDCDIHPPGRGSVFMERRVRPDGVNSPERDMRRNPSPAFSYRVATSYAAPTVSTFAADTDRLA